ncbi:MAG: NUDIX hydrolase [Candidatus Uhrbacteria bacterium]|nr:NUDIX hydrolase [Candidatus Uhrbacteria bacterium]MDP3793421.1 NUDIX hydrolase [Candidatus Uhrbacteria bacterium]
MPVPVPPHAKKICQTANLAVYEWPQKLYDGSTATFDAATRPDTVAVIPFLDANTILMTKQDQPGRPTFWDAPGGCVDLGESFEYAATRELYEETGYRTQNIMEWSAHKHQSVVRFEERIFIATDLQLDSSFQSHDPGEKIELIPLSWEKVLDLCFHYQIRRPLLALTLVNMYFDATQKEKWLAFLEGRVI